MDPVIIAGGGPVGLTLALALARHEVPSVVLDQGGSCEGRPPTTAVLRPDTAGLLRRVGCGRAVDGGMAWKAWRTVRRRQELLRVEFASALPGVGTKEAEARGGAGWSARARGAEAFPESEGDDGEPKWRRPAPVHLSQETLRDDLLEAVTTSPLIEFAKGCRLDLMEQDSTGVTVHTCGAASTWWRGSFLVGCDGPRSTVRKLLKVGFPGRTAVARYAVATIKTELPFPGEALVHWDPPHRGDREVTARPLPRGVWRLDWRLPSTRSTETGGRSDEALTPDVLIAKIRDALGTWCDGVPPYDLLASTEHLVHQRLAKRWRVGRAFLAGDAAHLLGALGTQSIDEGIRDAENLAWKLAVAWHASASVLLLDSYQAERRGAVASRLRAADQALTLLRPSGTLRSARRSVLSGPARKYSPLLSDGHLGTGLLGAPPVYRDSPLIAAQRWNESKAEADRTRTATPLGARVEDVPVTALDGTRSMLSERLGRDLLVVLVAPGTAVWESKHWLTAGLMPPLAAATGALPVRAELVVAETYPGATAHTVLLVRPDGHLAAVMPGVQEARLRAHADVLREDAPTHLASEHS